MIGGESEAFSAFVAPAVGKTSYGRLAAGVILCLAALMVASSIAVAGLLAFSLSRVDLEDLEMPAIVGNTLILRTLASILVLIPATWFAARFLHRQPFASLWGAHGRFPLRDLGLGLLAGLGISALTAAGAFLAIGLPERSSLDVGALLGLALPFLMLIGAQCFAEELFFRGYLVQHLRALSARPVVFVALPALIFAGMHLNPELPTLAQAGYVASTALFAITATILLMRTGSHAAPTGLHLGVNSLSLGVLGAEDILAGTQAFVYPAGHASQLIGIDVVVTAAALAALTLYVRRNPLPAA